MAIEFRPPRPEEFPQLHCLFVEVFGEPEFTDAFFRLGFSPERCLVAFDGQILGMLHWFDCALGGRPLAYLYAIAVKPAYQGRGIGSRLLRRALEGLRDYAGVFLVPAEESLFSYYERFGFRICAHIREETVDSGDPLPLWTLSPAQFAARRRELLPPEGVIQEGPSLALLTSYAKFYAVPGAVAVVSGGAVLEFLGDRRQLPGLLAALGLGQAPVRMPGPGRPLVMGFGVPGPLYFGLPMD